MRTIYDKAVRSVEFAEMFRKSFDGLMKHVRAANGTSPFAGIDMGTVGATIRGATVYSVSNLRSLYESSDASVDETYPQKFACIPPSQMTWIEAPSYNPKVDLHPFFYVFDLGRTGRHADCDRIVVVLNFFMARDEFFAEGCCLLRLDEHGCSTHPLYQKDLPDWYSTTRENIDRITRWSLMSTYFLAFLNCRNINIVEHSPSRQLRRAAERNNDTLPITYRTVEISSFGRTETGRPASQRTGETPRHLCRGHFKRYTADRPLLGKHVGQYWWDQHSRGNAERGVVFKDYHVDVSA